MHHAGHLPQPNTGPVSVFLSTGQVNAQGYQIWRKPKGVTWVSFVVVGGGGGGGGGFSRTAGSAGGGGGGGACSGVSRFACPASLLPDELYIQVGNGGNGGAAGVAGTAGTNSFVLFGRTAVLPNILVYSGVNAPGGGGAGTGAAAGAAGSVPTNAVTQPCNTWGQWVSTVGLAGAAGGVQTGAVGTSVTAWAAITLSPGAGGAGCTTTDFAGGGQTATALLDIQNQLYTPNTAGLVAPGGTGTGAAINGSSGIKRIAPFFNSGGAGGGSNNSGQAGNGGAGGYGCGGGGGGAGTTGGRGGNGGSGIVLISCI